MLIDEVQDDAAAAPGTPEERAGRERIIEALRAEGGNQTRAARRLGISRSTIIARIDAFRIPRPTKRS